MFGLVEQSMIGLDTRFGFLHKILIFHDFTLLWNFLDRNKRSWSLLITSKEKYGCKNNLLRFVRND